MLIRIDASSALPLSEQIATAVRRALADGALNPRRPAARRPGGDASSTSVHTVLRGYQGMGRGLAA